MQPSAPTSGIRCSPDCYPPENWTCPLSTSTVSRFDGVALVPVEVGHTDTDATTMLHVPDVGLLVAGDVVYNGVHLYLTESGGIAGIDEWLAALDIAEALRAAMVIPGHKDPRAFDNPWQIRATRRYLTDARRLVESSQSAEEFYREMLRLHPHRVTRAPAGALPSRCFPRRSPRGPPTRLVRHLKGVLRSDGHRDENERGPAAAGPLPTRRVCPTASRTRAVVSPTQNSGRCRTD